MKKLMLITVLLFLSGSVFSQHLINEAESVVFDEVGNRYFVANWGDGDIIMIDSSGSQYYFTSVDGGYVNGLLISGDTLFNAAANPNRIVAWDIETGEQILSVPDPLGGGSFDSITRDSSGNLYVTVSMQDQDDGYIYKLRLSDLSWSVFADSLVQFPQAIRFIPEDNSLIFCSAKNDPARIVKVNIADSSSVALLESSTNLHMDGITFDQFGNVYIASWDQDGVYRLDSNYTEPIELIEGGYDGPAGLEYNLRDNIIAVPEVLQSRVGFIQMYAVVECDTICGWPPFEVNFTGSSELEVDSWTWDFDDGDSSTEQSPSHTFTQAGVHNVTLEIQSGEYNYTRKQYIVAFGDTLFAPRIYTDIDTNLVAEISLANATPLNHIFIPIEYSGLLDITLDSISTAGCRTEMFDSVRVTSSDPINKQETISLWNTEFQTPDLEPGRGPVLKLYFTVPESAFQGQSAVINISGYSTKVPYLGRRFVNPFIPETINGKISAMTCGDTNGDKLINILDIVYLIDYLYLGGPAPVPYLAADVNGSNVVNILDITYLIAYLYSGGTDLNCP